MQPPVGEEEIAERAVGSGLGATAQIDIGGTVRADALKGQDVEAGIDDQTARLAGGIVFGDERGQLVRAHRARLHRRRFEDRLEGQDEAGDDDDQQRQREQQRRPAVRLEQIGLHYAASIR